MRVKRKAAKAQADLDGKLLKKSSLNISLLPENEADKTTAALLRMAPALTPGLATYHIFAFRRKARKRSIFLLFLG